MSRSALKCEKNEKAALSKLKKAIEQGNMEGAKIYGQNAIREKNQALNCLRMSSRIDAVASRLETAIRTKAVTKSMTGVVAGMQSAMKSMDVEKISKTMDEFEKQVRPVPTKPEHHTFLAPPLFLAGITSPDSSLRHSRRQSSVRGHGRPLRLHGERHVKLHGLCDPSGRG